jgi:tetratricopeptide (TPR) repeat protein
LDTCLFFETPQETIKYLKQLLEIDDQSPTYHFFLGMAYNDLDQYDKAITELEKCLEVYRKWGKKFLKNS